MRLLLVASALLASAAQSSSSQAMSLCQSSEFWSGEFRTCLPCKPCVVTLAPCTDVADAICGDADDAIMGREGGGDEPEGKR